MFSCLKLYYAYKKTNMYIHYVKYYKTKLADYYKTQYNTNSVRRKIKNVVWASKLAISCLLKKGKVMSLLRSKLDQRKI